MRGTRVLIRRPTTLGQYQGDTSVDHITNPFNILKSLDYQKHNHTMTQILQMIRKT